MSFCNQKLVELIVTSSAGVYFHFVKKQIEYQ